MTVEEVRREVVRSRVLEDGEALAAHVLLRGRIVSLSGKRLLFRVQSFNFARSSETQPLIWSILRSIFSIAACSSLIHPLTRDR